MFFDSIRRMQSVFKQIPILKQSERVYHVVVAFYVVFFIFGGLAQVVMINIGNRGFDSVARFVRINLTRSFINFLVYCGMQLAVCWICT